MSEMNRCMQKACVELKNISVQLGTMRKRMEEDERVRDYLSIEIVKKSNSSQMVR